MDDARGPPRPLSRRGLCIHDDKLGLGPCNNMDRSLLSLAQPMISGLQLKIIMAARELWQQREEQHGTEIQNVVYVVVATAFYLQCASRPFNTILDKTKPSFLMRALY
jgi:hypothetical protein